MPNVSALWLKPAHNGAMKPIDTLTLLEGTGIEGNADQGGWRQVTIISEDRWSQVNADLDATVDPQLRRANIMVAGLELAESRGRVLELGECLIEIRGETRPCRLMDEQHSGLRDALSSNWGGGVFGVVTRSGTVSVNDEARLLQGG
ncbi:MAG: MOSC domain-containing protein [Acidimicrobiia bacterium]|nr:MOSC domain-containing protein [Acidimicrobiia bacterium]NNC42926.1 MOSC domain-containing protein [Acidimicrobiia bacterium]NNL29135.1 MOSC domain-containing protein [Acidimicrobiia bacterium]